MACERIKVGDVTMIVCRERQRSKPCDSCGRPSSRLCDYPVTRNGKTDTCDRKLCNACARPMNDETDFCQAHWGIYEKNGRRLAL